MADSISVVIPTYNGEAYIASALESVFDQNLPPAEVIVVDDNSTDATRDIVNDIAKKASVRVHLHRLERNSGGPVTPMNTGIRMSTSNFVALLDQDDLMAPAKLESASKLFQSYPDSGVAFGQYVTIAITGIGQSFPSTYYEGFPESPNRLAPLFMLGSLVTDGYRMGGAGGMVIKKSAWDQVGGFDPHFRIAWDYDFAVRLALSEWPFAYSPIVYYRHREHAHNLAKVDAGLLGFCEHRRVLVKLWQQTNVPKSIRRLLRVKLSPELPHLGLSERKLGNYADAAFAYWLAIWLNSRPLASTRALIRLGGEAVLRRFKR